MQKVISVQNLFIFTDSANFLARVKALPKFPDVILLDVRVFPHNGFEMLEMLRADPEYCGTKVVALTAHVLAEEVERLRTYSFDSIIGKPVNMSIFPDLLSSILQGGEVWHIP